MGKPHEIKINRKKSSSFPKKSNYLIRKTINQGLKHPMLWRPSPAAIIVTFVTKFQLASGIWCPVRIIWKKVIKIFFPKNQIILLYQKDHNKGLVGDSSYCLVTPMPLCSKAPMGAKTSFSSTLTTFSYFVWRVGRKINARFVSIGQK